VSHVGEAAGERGLGDAAGIVVTDELPEETTVVGDVGDFPVIRKARRSATALGTRSVVGEVDGLAVVALAVVGDPVLVPT